MNYFRLLPLILFLLPLALFAQLSVSMTSDTLNIIAPTSTQFQTTTFLTSSLVNPNPETLTLDIIRVENDMPAQWSSGLCVDVCSLTIIDSIRISIPPGVTKEFKMYFGFVGEPYASTAHTKILFRNVSHPENYFLQDYYARINPSLSGIPENNQPSVSLFPNPVSDQVTLVNNASTETLDFILFDPLGKEVFRKQQLETNETIDLSRLNSGVYIYRLVGKNKLFASGKLTKK